MNFVQRLIVVTAAATITSVGTAKSSSSDWHVVEGAGIRLVTSGVPDDRGQLRGALEIRLKPGWKTYWRDPGDAGVPPTIDFGTGANARIVDMSFPAPKRFDDGYSIWAGYDEPMALAVTLQVANDDGPLEANVFLGVCETICIPVQATLTIDIASEPANPEHASVVAKAFASTPEPATPEFGARLTGVESDALVVRADVPAGAEVLDIFVASTQAFTLGTPETASQSDDGSYIVPIVDRFASEDEGEPIPYTLVTSAGNVSGTLTLP